MLRQPYIPQIYCLESSVAMPQSRDAIPLMSKIDS
jgi:hypothetical protein